MNSEIKQHL